MACNNLVPFDDAEWHAEDAEVLGLGYDAASAHIVYWFTWLVEHDLDSGFICTDGDDLIRRYVTDINRVKAAEPGAVLAMLSQAEQLNGSMLSGAGNRFTRDNYERYLRDYEHLFANGYAAFSSSNYSKVRPLLEAKYAKSLPSP